MVKIDTTVHIDETGKIPDGTIDIRFVDENNVYKSSTVTKTEAENMAEGYVLPDAFEFNGQKLSGIWVGKYEISNPKEAVGFNTTSTEESITVNSLTVVGESTATTDAEDVTKKDVKIYLDGNVMNDDKYTKLPFTISGLEKNHEYKITVTIETGYGDPIKLDKKVRTTEGSVNDITNPDLTGFEPQNTYFVIFDNQNGEIKEKIQTEEDTIVKSKKIATNAPDGWYDYNEKKWANIVTMKDDGTACYWTWVPRYEYKIDEKLNSVDIVYITANQTEADEGYEIPDAFKFGGKVLSGIWVGKYEIQNVAIPTGFTTASIDGGFRVTGITYNGENQRSGMPQSGTMTVKSEDGSKIVKDPQTISVGGEIKGLSSGIYTVSWNLEISYPDSNGSKQYKEVTQKIAVRASVQPAVPDLSGFNNPGVNCYYVVKGSGTGVDDSLSIGAKVTFGPDGMANNIPSDWYNYTNKQWANIIVSKESLDSLIGKNINSSTLVDIKDVTMWVWVPRYEYKIDDDGNSVSAIFINNGDSVDTGYNIPDAFKFGGKVLSGIWVGKYEIADKQY